jgi:hypothetical protein
VQCPKSVTANGQPYPLDQASVFDGKPEELADLVPVDGTWILKEYRTASREMYLVCRYKGTNEVSTVHIPRSAAQCRMTGGSVVSVICR